MRHIFCVQSSAEGHFGCFNILTIVNSAAVHTEVHAPFELEFCLNTRPQGRLLDHTAMENLLNHPTSTPEPLKVLPSQD